MLNSVKFKFADRMLPWVTSGMGRCIPLSPMHHSGIHMYILHRVQTLGYLTCGVAPHQYCTPYLKVVREQFLPGILSRVRGS